jgi:hypothetical protein
VINRNHLTIKGVFGLREKNRKEKKTQKSKKEFELKLVAIH